MSDHSITSPAEITEVVKVDLFGDVGAKRFDEALDALHLFAQATGCLAGGSVIAWFAEKDREARALALAERVMPGWHVGVQPWFHTDPDRVTSRAYLIRPDWKRWNPTGDEWCDQHHGRSCHTAAFAVVSALLRAQSEARI
ncbi:hypothetical protein [Brevundimonas sp. SPF441]|uniref:hypothetical protein n=1 Tax=Brevundimonas sp. SPF441 TaxID=2663795 RepID=UPI00129E7DAB|nr:hypothetical protein [Brevundimonas sp. SPF441]MRL69858.1 hypothetical protein [Brevundimonas sp. SPF441]